VVRHGETAWNATNKIQVFFYLNFLASAQYMKLFRLNVAFLLHRSRKNRFNFNLFLQAEAFK
jgi:hypothetical protein